MKRTMKACLLALLVLMTVLAFAACAGNHEHTFEERWSTNATHHWHSGNCEHTQQITEMGEHTWTTEGTVTLKPGCTTVGKNTYSCTVCGLTKSDDIPAVGHTYSDASWSYTVIEGLLCREKRCDSCDAVAEQEVIENAVVATDAVTAQYALDNATAGSYLYLLPDVEYGTLYLRAFTSNTAVNVGGWAGGQHMYFRSIQNLTILGANGATIDALCIEAGTYTPDGNQHSYSSSQPYLQSFIALENLVIENVTFSGAADGLRLEGNVCVDGLTFDGCTMNDQGEHYLLYRTGTVYTCHDLISGTDFMTTTCKDVTIQNCNVNGAYMVAELRGTENVTVTGNTFTGIASRVILLAADGTAYTGTVTVTDNTVEGCGDRFLRAELVEADVVVTGNTVSGYTGTDTDIVKITNMSGEDTIADNDWGNADLTVTVEPVPAP